MDRNEINVGDVVTVRMTEDPPHANRPPAFPGFGLVFKAVVVGLPRGRGDMLRLRAHDESNVTRLLYVNATGPLFVGMSRVADPEGGSDE